MAESSTYLSRSRAMEGMTHCVEYYDTNQLGGGARLWVVIACFNVDRAAYAYRDACVAAHPAWDPSTYRVRTLVDYASQ